MHRDRAQHRRHNIQQRRLRSLQCAWITGDGNLLDMCHANVCVCAVYAWCRVFDIPKCVLRIATKTMLEVMGCWRFTVYKWELHLEHIHDDDGGRQAGDVAAECAAFGGARVSQGGEMLMQESGHQGCHADAGAGCCRAVMSMYMCWSVARLTDIQ